MLVFGIPSIDNRSVESYGRRVLKQPVAHWRLLDLLQPLLAAPGINADSEDSDGRRFVFEKISATPWLVKDLRRLSALPGMNARQDAHEGGRLPSLDNEG